MSTLPENEFDLEKLFLPAWAQEPSSAKYAFYEGEEERPERRGERRGPRPPRREGAPGFRRDDNRPRGDQRGGPARPEGGRGRSGPGERPPPRRGEVRERREPVAPLPEINVAFLPDDKGVESLARQIKMTGRAYPLFDIAQMVLQKPERHNVVFSIKKNAEGQPVQPLFVCALDDTLWLSADEAVSHVLRHHFATFYQPERTATEPPKGKYTFVAQCGLSGIVLGPPNHHDYQNQLRKLHTERFSRMPFEVYKSRVKIVRDEEVVKKWIEDQSWRTEFICLNLPEPLRLGNMEAVTQHFRETHKESIIKTVESHTLGGVAAKSLRCSELARLVRNVWEDQRRFPLQIATALSQQFAGHGLQFFKVNKAITHVCVARPHYLDLAAAPVSEGVKRIVEFVNARPRSTRRELVEALAPSPAVPTGAASAPAEGPAVVPAESAQPTPEQTTVIADLHWLIHQGHVIEFANGILETAKRPIPKPPRPEPKPTDKKAETIPPTEPAAESAAVEPAQTAVPSVEPAMAPGSEPVIPVNPKPDEPAGSTSAPAMPVAPVLPAETHSEPGSAVPAVEKTVPPAADTLPVTDAVALGVPVPPADAVAPAGPVEPPG